VEFGPFLNEKEDIIKKAVRPEEYDKIKELIGLANEDDLGGETIQQAKVLRKPKEYWYSRLWSYHYTPSDITNFVPVATAKDSICITLITRSWKVLVY
jgi:DNA polymerase-3 subunit alpha